MIRCECPKCSEILELGDDYAGLVTACKHCGELLTVPIPELAPPPVATAPPPIPNYMPSASAVPTLTDAPPQTSGLAIASLSLGIASFLCLGPLCAIPGIITGHMALSQFKKAPRQFKGQGIATTGLVMSYINIAVVGLLIVASVPAAILLPALARSREAARRVSCQNNLKQVGIVFKMFANENKDLFPELNPQPGRLIFANAAPNLGSIFPEYVSDLDPLQCPSDTSSETLPAEANQGDPQATFDRSSYTYLGYVVTNEAELGSFVQAYKRRLEQGLRFNDDMYVSHGTGSCGGDKLLRLHENIERDLVKDLANPAAAAAAQASIPIMWDRFSFQPNGGMEFNHIPGGANVLFMDGHVEFIKYPGKFPVTREAAQLLNELESLK